MQVPATRACDRRGQRSSAAAMYFLSYVGLDEVADGVWSVYFGNLLLGRLNERDYRMHAAHNRNRI